MTNQAAWPSFPVVDTTFLGSGENHHKDEWDDDIPVIELTGLSHSEFPGPAHDEEFELLIEGLAEALQSGMARRLDGIVREAVEELVPKVIQRFNRDSENELRALIRQQLPSIRAQIMREIGESTQDPDD
ncbi:MAG: hypothetical protein J4A00_03760 [Gammaproteobacteria bacterium]|nr:hypothetical protein [Gammaproteobacteria bacterium]